MLAGVSWDPILFGEACRAGLEAEGISGDAQVELAVYASYQADA
jgi:hypothetical protein